MAEAVPLFQACGLDGQIDDGFIALNGASGEGFITRCAALRYWQREEGNPA